MNFCGNLEFMIKEFRASHRYKRVYRMTKEKLSLKGHLQTECLAKNVYSGKLYRE